MALWGTRSNPRFITSLLKFYTPMFSDDIQLKVMMVKSLYVMCKLALIFILGLEKRKGIYANTE
jgi:hypothetical protein